MKKVIARIFWIVVIVLMCLWTFEFYRVRNGEDPKFCISNRIYTYVDGVTEECIGLGYKVYEYRRNYLKGTEFVSIFAKQRKEDIDKEPKVEDTVDQQVEEQVENTPDTVEE